MDIASWTVTLLPPVFLYTAPLSGSARRGEALVRLAVERELRLDRQVRQHPGSYGLSSRSHCLAGYTELARVLQAGDPGSSLRAARTRKAVLAWTGKDTLAERDYEQIGLQLTGHARAVATDARRRANQLPENSGPRALADVVLPEAEGRLSATLEGTVRCVQNRARLVRALYERLDRLEAALAPERVAPSGG